jgi:pyrroline-5-carboxylate reductase
MAVFDSIVVIGAGKMGGALVDGWLARALIRRPSALSIRRLKPMIEAGLPKGVACFARRALDVAAPALVLLAIKPQMMPGAAWFGRS